MIVSFIFNNKSKFDNKEAVGIQRFRILHES